MKRQKLNQPSPCIVSKEFNGKYTTMPSVMYFYYNKNERDYAASQADKLPHYLEHSVSDHLINGTRQYWLNIIFSPEAKKDWWP